MPKVQRRKGSGASKTTVAITFDNRTLDTLLKYVVSSSVHATDLTNLRKVFERLDPDVFRYGDSTEEGISKLGKIQLIRWIASAKSEAMLQDEGAIISYLEDKCPEIAEFIPMINWDPQQLAPSDVRQISKSIAEKLQYLTLLSAREEVMETYEKLANCQFHSMQEYVDRMRQILTRLLVNIQNTTIGNGLVQDFNFSSLECRDLLQVIVNKAHRPESVLQTGIKELNKMLSPGFQSGRLYTFLGLTGGFKSGTLLNMADQLRRYNPQIKPVENGKRRTILYVTMENTVEETIGRLYDMYSEVTDDMSHDDLNKVFSVFESKDANYKFSDSVGIDISFKYRANLSISTADLYNMIQAEEDSGREVICLILDYIKRINSPKDWNGDERIRLSYVAQELKALAEYFEIPVITAQQINREGNAIVDAATREDKEDVLRFVGSANIGSAWAIAEESDWLAIINREIQKSSGKMYLTVKRAKLRGKDIGGSEYFNHPFTNSKNIRLVADLNEPFSASIRSLATDLKTARTNDQFENDHARPVIDNNLQGHAKSNKVLQTLGLDDFGKLD